MRASRSFPFVSKIYNENFVDLAIRAILGQPVPRPQKSFFDLDYVGVKAPQFSFTRLRGADPTVGVEMASTGEVGCVGDDFDEAFLKALFSVGFRFPIGSISTAVRQYGHSKSLSSTRPGCCRSKGSASLLRGAPQSSWEAMM